MVLPKIFFCQKKFKMLKCCQETCITDKFVNFWFQKFPLQFFNICPKINEKFKKKMFPKNFSKCYILMRYMQKR